MSEAVQEPACWQLANSTSLYTYPSSTLCGDSTKGIVFCCFGTDICVQGGICHFTRQAENTSGYYLAGCTDGSYEDTKCSKKCCKFAIQTLHRKQISHHVSCLPQSRYCLQYEHILMGLLLQSWQLRTRLSSSWSGNISRNPAPLAFSPSSSIREFYIQWQFRILPPHPQLPLLPRVKLRPSQRQF